MKHVFVVSSMKKNSSSLHQYMDLFSLADSLSRNMLASFGIHDFRIPLKI